MVAEVYIIQIKHKPLNPSVMVTENPREIDHGSHAVPSN